MRPKGIIVPRTPNRTRYLGADNPARSHFSRVFVRDTSFFFLVWFFYYSTIDDVWLSKP